MPDITGDPTATDAAKPVSNFGELRARCARNPLVKNCPGHFIGTYDRRGPVPLKDRRKVNTFERNRRVGHGRRAGDVSYTALPYAGAPKITYKGIDLGVGSSVTVQMVRRYFPEEALHDAEICDYLASAAEELHNADAPTGSRFPLGKVYRALDIITDRILAREESLRDQQEAQRRG